jgi:hypothetical protein
VILNFVPSGLGKKKTSTPSANAKPSWNCLLLKIMIFLLIAAMLRF